jgi:hypothetical protein
MLVERRYAAATRTRLDLMGWYSREMQHDRVDESESGESEVPLVESKGGSAQSMHEKLVSQNDSLWQNVCSNDHLMYSIMVFRLERLHEAALRNVAVSEIIFLLENPMAGGDAIISEEATDMETFRGPLESFSVHILKTLQK